MSWEKSGKHVDFVIYVVTVFLMAFSKGFYTVSELHRPELHTEKKSSGEPSNIAGRKRGAVGVAAGWGASWHHCPRIRPPSHLEKTRQLSFVKIFTIRSVLKVHNGGWSFLRMKIWQHILIGQTPWVSCLSPLPPTTNFITLYFLYSPLNVRMNWYTSPPRNNLNKLRICSYKIEERLFIFTLMRLALLHFQDNSSSESVVDWVPTNLDFRIKFFIPAIPWALLPLCCPGE